MFEEYLVRILEGAAWRVEPVSGGDPNKARLIASKDLSRVGIVVSADPSRDVGPELVLAAAGQIDELMLTRAAVVSQAGFTAAAQREAAETDPPVALIGRGEIFRIGVLLDQMPEPERAEEAGGGMGRVIAACVVVGLLGVGGFGWYYSHVPAKQTGVGVAAIPAATPTPDAAAPPPAAELAAVLAAPAPDNTLSAEEQANGWQLLFNGSSTSEWINGARKAAVGCQIEDNALKPVGLKEEAIYTKRAYKDFELAMDYKVSPGFRGGVAVRVFPTNRLEGSKSIRDNGTEVSLCDAAEGFETAGGLRDFVAPNQKAELPAGLWNKLKIRCFGGLVAVELNGKLVAEMDLDHGWDKSGFRPDGTKHRLGFPIGRRSRVGPIALFRSDQPSWFKNIKIRQLNSLGV